MIPVPQLLMLGSKVAPYVIGAVGSFAQAAMQKKAMQEAEQEAAKAIADARAKLMQAPLEEVQVPTEAYQNAMREITAQSMQLTEAARESGARELAASVGRIGAAGLQATEQQRESMADRIYARDMTVAQDEARRLGALSNIDLGEARGAQAAAAQAEARRGAAITGGLTALGGAASAGLEAYALYGYGRPELDAMTRNNANQIGMNAIFGPNGQFSSEQFLSGFGMSPMASGAYQPIERIDSSMLDGLEDLVPLIPRR